MQTRDIMTSPVVTVTPDAGLKAAAATLVEHGVNAVPVVADDGRLVGIVSEADLLRPEAPAGAGRGSPPARQGPRTVREVMTQAVYTISEDADAAAAARLMLRLVARSDQDIHADLERRLKEEVGALQRLGIHVSDGVVTFSGRVGPLARELSKVLAGAVPGVVGVRWQPPRA
jgi:CBS domain-containing protein